MNTSTDKRKGMNSW